MGNTTEPLFLVGELVRVKELDVLKREFGESIDVPCSFPDAMEQYCGKQYNVEYAYSRSYAPPYYTLIGTGGWCFDECVLEAVEPVDEDTSATPPRMEFDQLF